MDQIKKDLDDEKFEEPAFEDFFPTEKEQLLKEKSRKWKAFFTKIIAVCVSLAMFISAVQLWPQLFNLSSLSFLQRSTELSQQEDIQTYKKAVVTIQDMNSKGTGFNISETGIIITNYHVIDKMNPITVIFPDGRIFHATPIITDEQIDLAILQLDGEDLPFLSLIKPVKWNSGDHVYVIGNPMLHSQIVIEGKILDGSHPDSVLMLAAPIYKGNSGSPVINSAGNVVGVIYAKQTTDQPIGYAIPIEKVLKKLN
ncbi:S1C family serine protease [Niallia sp. Krafla_26]|uniref:S1C family serine protease n=1 Tax=Niallia sp. Krafla_26 TaxID=3064703 RepID=UPI003D1670AD